MATAPDRPSSLLLALLVAPAFGAPASNIVLDLDKCAVDLKTDTAVCHDISVSQGDARIQARRAQGSLLFDNTTWTFEGDVHVTAEQRGRLRSDRAVVDFRNKRIEKAVITGTPAEFEQQIDAGRLAHGRAGEIVYDVRAGTVRLSQDARLASEGRPEMSAPTIVYNIREKKVQASSQDSDKQRVHIVIPVTKPEKPAQ